MPVPLNQCLVNQTFNSEFVEYVWQVPIGHEKNQIIFKVYKDGGILLEEGFIDGAGEYKDGAYTTSGILTTKNISFKDLTVIKDAAIQFLNES